MLETRVDREAPDFAANRERMAALVDELKARTAEAALGGGDRRWSATAHAASSARERIDRLIDPGTAFLELNALAAYDLYDGDAPAAGLVTGSASSRAGSASSSPTTRP